MAQTKPVHVIRSLYILLCVLCCVTIELQLESGKPGCKLQLCGGSSAPVLCLHPPAPCLHPILFHPPQQPAILESTAPVLEHSRFISKGSAIASIQETRKGEECQKFIYKVPLDIVYNIYYIYIEPLYAGPQYQPILSQPGGPRFRFKFAPLLHHPIYFLQVLNCIPGTLFCSLLHWPKGYISLNRVGGVRGCAILGNKI